MRVLTVLGTRPEIIRLSQVMGKLEHFSDHKLVHTGQNYDPNLSDVFFGQLGLRQPDHYLGVGGGSFADQMGKLLVAGERVLRQEKPDRVLILGDTNSCLLGFVAKRMGIPVFHMEAGNRCYDDRVPEEVNRRIVDHTSDVLMPYTERSRMNLLREGIDGYRIHVTGNPIHEVICHYEVQIRQSDVLARLALEAGRYFLVTVHREENVDVPERLQSIVEALDRLHQEYQMPVVVSLHPRTKKRLAELKTGTGKTGVLIYEPFGFFDFVALERNAHCVLSDSGTVQEECCIFKVANVTLRDVTERPETIDAGSNMLSGAEPQSILRAVRVVLGQKSCWRVPPEYLAENVSDIVVRIVLGYLSASLHPSFHAKRQG